MSLRDSYGTDKEKENNGVRVELPANEDGSVPVVILSRMAKSNKAYAKTLQAETRPFERQLQLKTLKEETAAALFLKVFCKSVVKGWENMQLNEGENLPFNEENAIMLFTELPELYEELAEKATGISLFRAEVREVNAGN